MEVHTTQLPVHVTVLMATVEIPVKVSGEWTLITLCQQSVYVARLPRNDVFCTSNMSI